MSDEKNSMNRLLWRWISRIGAVLAIVTFVVTTVGCFVTLGVHPLIVFFPALFFIWWKWGFKD